MINSLSIDTVAVKPKSNISPPLFVALIASLLLHAAVLSGRQLDLSPAPELKPLEITIVRTAPDLKAGDTPPPPQDLVGIPVDRDRSFRFVVTGDSGLS